jgi:hypothetical protein
MGNITKSLKSHVTVKYKLQHVVMYLHSSTMYVVVICIYSLTDDAVRGEAQSQKG